MGNQKGLTLLNTDTEGVYRQVRMLRTELSTQLNHLAGVEPQVVKIIRLSRMVSFRLNSIWQRSSAKGSAHKDEVIHPYPMT